GSADRLTPAAAVEWRPPRRSAGAAGTPGRPQIFWPGGALIRNPGRCDRCAQRSTGPSRAGTVTDGYNAMCTTTWKAIDRGNLDALVARDLADCSEEQRAFFHRAAYPPVKWRQSPWGDAGGGFWTVAV